MSLTQLVSSLTVTHFKVRKQAVWLTEDTHIGDLILNKPQRVKRRVEIKQHFMLACYMELFFSSDPVNKRLVQVNCPAMNSK